MHQETEQDLNRPTRWTTCLCEVCSHRAVGCKGRGLVVESVIWLHGGVQPHWQRVSNSDFSAVSHPGRGGCMVLLKLTCWMCWTLDFSLTSPKRIKLAVSSRPYLVCFRERLCVHSEEKVTVAANLLRLQLLDPPRLEDRSCLAPPKAEEPSFLFFCSCHLARHRFPQTWSACHSHLRHARCSVSVPLRSLRLQPARQVL